MHRCVHDDGRMPDTIRYVAIGDSFSEGLGDAGVVPFPGWTGRLASGMARAHDADVRYANLAVRGRLLAGVLEDQLDAALALDPTPTLITFCAGGNDLLRPRFDARALVAPLEEAVRTVLDRGVHLTLLSPADPSARLPWDISSTRAATPGPMPSPTSPAGTTCPSSTCPAIRTCAARSSGPRTGCT